LFTLTELESILTYGIFLSLVYGLMAVGVTIIFGLMKLINFAHGEMYMMGGYAMYFFCLYSGLSPFLGIPISFATGFLLGSAIEAVFIRQTYTKVMEKPGEYAVIVTFGISLFLQNVALLGFGIYTRSPPSFLSGTILIGNVTIAGNVVVASAMSAVILLATYLFVEHTWIGLSMKANSQNLVGAKLAGIRPTWVNNFGFALGAALAAIAGGLLGSTYFVWPYSGMTPILIAFTIVVLGGLGSIKGAVIGAFIIGLSYSFLGVLVSFAYVDIYGLIILIIVLVIRPSGLFGEKERTY
jgi:branched-chain amino acid transport system permease protein